MTETAMIHHCVARDQRKCWIKNWISFQSFSEREGTLQESY